MGNEKSAILTQNAAVERKNRVRWLIAISSLPLFGIVAAFGIAPQTDTQQIAIRSVTESVILPSLAAKESTGGTFWSEEKIQRGDTISSLLSRLNVDNQDISDFLQSARGTKSMQLLIPGKPIEAQTTPEGKLLTLRYIPNSDTMLVSERHDDGFQTHEQAVPLEKRTTMKSARINHSLFGATDAANIPDAIAIQLADIFSSEIDFHLDLRKGDTFSVVYDGEYNKGGLVKPGRILAAEFVNQGKTYRAVYFQDHEGHGGYYTPNGKNLRKAFLRAPLAFSRVTSGFSMRFHPILKEWRAHKGVDYGAPIGTPVHSVADGVVAFAGVQRGYGNLLVIQHSGQYSTAYGHLKSFARGIHKGSKVSQGDTVAYVGMTGMATGPHLHFEFRVAGIQRNPLTVAIPTSFPIAPKYRAAFFNIAKPLLARIDLLRNTNLASLE